MQFELDEAQRDFAESVRSFARKHLADGALGRAHDTGFPWDVARLMADQGLLGLTVPEADGGQGASLLDAVIAIQEIGAVCPRSADVVQAGNFGPLRTFAEYATPEQKERWLPGLLSGRSLLSLGMSEPDAGSALTDLTTSARPEGDGTCCPGRRSEVRTASTPTSSSSTCVSARASAVSARWWWSAGRRASAPAPRRAT